MNKCDKCMFLYTYYSERENKYKVMCDYHGKEIEKIKDKDSCKHALYKEDVVEKRKY
jgi:hypothetical protein